MGAGEFILKDRFSLVRDTIEQVAGCFRVLTVAHVPGGFTEDGDMAGAAEPVALVLNSG